MNLKRFERIRPVVEWVCAAGWLDGECHVHYSGWYIHAVKLDVRNVQLTIKQSGLEVTGIHPWMGQR